MWISAISIAEQEPRFINVSDASELKIIDAHEALSSFQSLLVRNAGGAPLLQASVEEQTRRLDALARRIGRGDKMLVALWRQSYDLMRIELLARLENDGHLAAKTEAMYAAIKHAFSQGPPFVDAQDVLLEAAKSDEIHFVKASITPPFAP